jgi:5'-3' exonuclease
MKYNNILIDLCDYYHRSFAIKQKEISDGRTLLNETVILTIKQVLNLKKNYLEDNGTLWILQDNPVSKKINRKILDPDYKANRIKESDPFYRGLDYTFIILSKYDSNINCVRIKALEADDLVKPIIDEFIPNQKNLLASADMDWARCMSENTHWLSRNGIHTQETFKETYKFTPNENTVTLYKSIQGDNSDNIPAIKGINEQTTLNIIENYFNVYDIFESIKRKDKKSELLSDYTKKHLVENKDRLILNHQLIYFNYVSKQEISSAIIKGQFNETALKIFYEQINFPASFDKRIKIKKPTIDDVFSFDDIKRK